MITVSIQEMLEFIKSRQGELATYEISFINSVEYKFTVGVLPTQADKDRLTRLYRDLSE